MHPAKTIKTVATNDIYFIPFVLSVSIVPINIVKKVIDKGIYETLTPSANKPTKVPLKPLTIPL